MNSLTTNTVRAEPVEACPERLPQAASRRGLSFSKAAGTIEGQGFDRFSPNGVGQVAKQFEAIFLRQMIAAMRNPSLGEALFGSDAANQFRDMSDARLADSMAGQFGIARLLEKQLGT